MRDVFIIAKHGGDDEDVRCVIVVASLGVTTNHYFPRHTERSRNDQSVLLVVSSSDKRLGQRDEFGQTRLMKHPPPRERVLNAIAE